MRFLAGALVVASLLGVRGVAVAVCGDGIVDSDAYEQCDDGAANGLDGCCSTTCQIVDVDGDGQCDARDACHNGTGIRIKDAVLKIGGLATPASDDMIRFAGTLTVPIAPAIDPASSGIRLTMFAPYGDPRGSAVVDLTVPGGPLWRASAGGTSWRYRDAAGDAAGITRVAIKLLPPLVPSANLTKVAFSLSGRRGSYPITPAMVTVDPNTYSGNTLQVTLALGPGSASTLQCGSVYYSTIQLTSCRFGASGDGVTCRGPRRVGPCHVGDPDDLVVCDAENAARAEVAYFFAHGAFYSGDCTGMPTFVPSPGVACSAAGIRSGYSSSTAHPQAYRSCTYVSTASDPLVCS